MFLLLFLLPFCQSIVFTLPVHASECFFEQRALGAKCAVRFEVERATRALDVDVDIYDSSGTAVFATHAQQAGVAVFTVAMSGSYRVCFSTRFSSMGEKRVDVEIDCGADSAGSSGTGGEGADDEDDDADGALQASEVAASAEQLSLLAAELNEVYHEQKRLMSRSHAHHDTNESTNQRVSYWGTLELLLCVALAVFQVLWLRRFVEQRRG